MVVSPQASTRASSQAQRREHAGLCAAVLVLNAFDVDVLRSASCGARSTGRRAAAAIARHTGKQQACEANQNDGPAASRKRPRTRWTGSIGTAATVGLLVLVGCSGQKPFSFTNDSSVPVVVHGCPECGQGRRVEPGTVWHLTKPGVMTIRVDRPDGSTIGCDGWAFAGEHAPPEVKFTVSTLQDCARFVSRKPGT